MTIEERKKNFISADSLVADDVIKIWDIPGVERINPNVYSITPEQPVRIELTQADIDIIKKSAQIQGYGEGYQAGFGTGKERVEKEIQYVVAMAKEIIYPLKQIDETLEKSIVNLICSMVKQVLLAELTIKPEHVLNILEQCLQSLPVIDQKISLHCHPDDMRYIEVYLKLRNDSLDCELIKDETLSRGSIKVSTHHTKVTADLDQRLHEVLSQVIPEYVAKQSGDTDGTS